MEQMPALLAALRALAPAASPAALRRVLHALIDDEATPNVTTPPMHDATDGAAAALDSTDVLPRAAPPSLTERTMRPASPAKPAPRVRAPSKGSGSNEVRDWLVLRDRVKATAAAQGLDRPALATALGLAPATVHKAMGHRRPPSGPIMARMRHWLADAPR